MSSAFIHFISEMPKPPMLGSTFSYCMEHQVAAYEASLSVTDKASVASPRGGSIEDKEHDSYTTKERFDLNEPSPSSHVIQDELRRMVLDHEDKSAFEAIADAYRIPDLELTADDLAALARVEPEAYKALFSGSIGTAIDMLRNVSYPIKFAHADERDESDVQEMVVTMCRLWLAADLQDHAVRCRKRIYSPTNFKPFDQTPHGGAPQAQNGASMLLHYLDTFDRTIAIYFQGLRRPPARGFLNAARYKDGPGLAYRFGPGIRGAYEVTFQEFARPASLRDTNFVRNIGLEVAAQEQLAIWRKAHGDEMEGLLEAHILGLQNDAHRLRSDIVSFMSGLGRNVSRGKADGLAPLVSMCFAIEHAISLTVEPSAPDRARLRSDAVPANAPAVDIITAWVRDLWNGKTPLEIAATKTAVGACKAKPAVPKACLKDRHTVRNALFAYRVTVIEDPDCLPTKARTVVCKVTGTVTRVKHMAQATELRGQRYTFEELVELSAAGHSAGMERPMLTSITIDANRFRKKYVKSSSAKAVSAVKEARGIIEWRLAS